MFRNPRENASSKPTTTILPSTGRAPTPPPDGAQKQSPYFAQNVSSNNRSSPISGSQIAVLGRQSTIKITGGKKNGGKQNQSILNFFGKAPPVEGNQTASIAEGLFFEDGGILPDASPAKSSMFIQSPKASSQEQDVSRFNENITPVKRRRVGSFTADELLRTPSPGRAVPDSTPWRTTSTIDSPTVKEKQHKHRGGFIDDSSDDEDKDENENENSVPEKVEDDSKFPDGDQQVIDHRSVTPIEDEIPFCEVVETTKVPLRPSDDSVNTGLEDNGDRATGDPIPMLKREATSMGVPDDFGDDDFDDEFFQEGEEFLEREWMAEQQEMEAAFDEDSKSESGTEGPSTPTTDTKPGNIPTGEGVALCPICNGSMQGLSENQASSHVNACLDGTAQPLKPTESITKTAIKSESNSSPKLPGPMKRFQRSAVARPAQANPFVMSPNVTSKGSAFNRLMSGNAEDRAWAEAAANENLSRGKPAYARTCPFYKIMPGLYICVDAFRYGKVEGQNAYFLSHFHSDHYIGLTSTWCHGPIYASKVSCNLMRQQLRVDSKWLHPLEFEKKVEVPNTKGVFVTMIPANHCPGSSLFLFEKVIGKNKDGSPRLQRILHCGDFRACPAHVHHPLLRPDVQDAITGEDKQQIIDTCYLDTTYLTPKFSFPSQYDVINACANMCVSLSKDIPDINDNWEQVKMAKAGSIMTNFLDEGKKDIVKKEEDIEAEDKKPRLRGRLLVVCGTYSIGKERICLGIARALNSKIFVPPAKMRICKALEDDELNALLTSDPLQAQVHMQMLMEIRADTLHDYLVTFKGQFSRIVGFRPTGWTYRPPSSRFTDNPTVQSVLHSEGWKSRFTMQDLAPQRGSTKESNCFGVPYSEHSSFRELTMFCCALRINRIIPTVNVGNARSRERMKGWIEKWDADKKKNGLYKVEVGAEGWGSGDGKLRYGV